jgi:hypothetical protein
MTYDKIVIATTNYWQKTRLKVGIAKPNSTPQISGDDYVQLVRDAISMWNDALCKYSKKAAHKHLRKIEFKVSENFKGDEDVLVQWWYSDRGNGITVFRQSLIFVFYLKFMEKYEKLLNMLMNFDDSIRFAVVCDKDGEILWNSQRKGIECLTPLEDTKKALKRAINSWYERSDIMDKVGHGLYSIVSYEKIKRVTVPLDNNNLLLLNMDNTPQMEGKKKSYGHLADMGKIMSIVDFINSES